VVTLPWPRFELLETMRAERGNLIRLDRHLRRMQESAEYFGFCFCESDVRRVVAETMRGVEGVRRVRLRLAPDGQARCEVHELEVLPAELTVALASGPADSRSPFLFHKTTNRQLYDLLRQSVPGGFDVLMYNERDEITEFTRGNVVVQLAGRRYTPPRACGLLAGVFRGELLQRGKIAERVIPKNEIAHAERIWFVNSVREWVEVKLV
jgi:para-aminobenzoate synthetase/4-amino-4-deoxychorismate lyase